MLVALLTAWRLVAGQPDFYAHGFNSTGYNAILQAVNCEGSWLPQAT
jgi:hypothetical protein